MAETTDNPTSTSPGRKCSMGRLLRDIFIRGAQAAEASRHRAAMHQARVLADYLEHDAFPWMRDNRTAYALATVPEDGSSLRARGPGETTEHPVAETDALAAALAAAGVRRLEWDTRLEAGQIVDAVLTVLRAGPHLAHANPTEQPLPRWRGEPVAGSLLGSAGVQQFCTTMHVDRDTNTFRVTYTFCEPYPSLLLDRWVGRLGRTHDHRAVLAAAPWLGLATAAIIAAVVAVGEVWPWTGLLLGLLLAGGAGLVVGWLVYMLGAMRYERDHRDALLAEGLRQVEALSHFPLNNPSAVLKVGEDGSILFANPAAKNMLAALSDASDLTCLLPDDYREWIADALGDRSMPDEREVTRNGVTIRYRRSVFPNEPAVLLAGQDISELKRLENELRKANETLEERVQVRTIELLLTQDVTIMTLSSLAESRDQETGAHIERTRRYVKVLAEQLRDHPRFSQLLGDPEAAELLYRSAPLHDIGKVGVPDAILRKPGPLTEAEYAEMKKHPIYGGDALGWAEKRLGSNSFLQIARDIAYYHHEKWDGTGYPYGLHGDDIPIAARLMALADVYDALTSKRYYKDAFPHEQARESIRAMRGTHFDPDVVDAFLAREQDFARIAQEFKDEQADEAEIAAARQGPAK